MCASTSSSDSLVLPATRSRSSATDSFVLLASFSRSSATDSFVLFHAPWPSLCASTSSSSFMFADSLSRSSLMVPSASWFPQLDGLAVRILPILDETIEVAAGQEQVRVVGLYARLEDLHRPPVQRLGVLEPAASPLLDGHVVECDRDRRMLAPEGGLLCRERVAIGLDRSLVVSKRRAEVVPCPCDLGMARPELPFEDWQRVSKERFCLAISAERVQDRRPGRLVLGRRHVLRSPGVPPDLDRQPRMRLGCLELPPRVLEPAEVVVERRAVGVILAE